MVLIRRFGLALALLLMPLTALAQLPPATVTANLTSATCTAQGGTSAGCVTLTIAGQATVGIQVTGTWVGTLTFRASVDRTTFATMTCTPPNSTSGATTTTGNGQWTCPVAGLAMAEVIFTAYTSGTAVVPLQWAGGGRGGGGGGGGAAGSVTINDPNTTSQKAAVNASGQLSITCANCSGSGASAVDNAAFTAGTTSGAPAMGFYHSTIDAVTDGNAATLAMDATRNLFSVVRDAAGNARGANVSAANALKVDPSAVTSPVSAASLPLPTGAATETTLATIDTDVKANITLHAGTNVIGHVIADTGSTTAVTQATGTNLHAVLDANSGVDIGKLTANQSVNLAQLAATTTDTNSGSKSAGTLRVVIATDQPQLTNKLLVTPDSVALPANQSVNVAQMNGVTTTMGNGVAGTGVQRVAIASDNTAFSIKTTDGTLTHIVDPCDGVAHTQAAFNATANVKIISATSAKTNYICGIFFAPTSDAENVSIVDGTGSTCATGTAADIGATTAANGAQGAANGGWVLPVGAYAWAKSSTTNVDTCIFISGSGKISGVVVYVQN